MTSTTASDGRFDEREQSTAGCSQSYSRFSPLLGGTDSFACIERAGSGLPSTPFFTSAYFLLRGRNGKRQCNLRDPLARYRTPRPWS